MPAQSDNIIEITLQDLRAIIHGLEMAPLAFVEEGAMDEIGNMIKNLPGAEKINTLDPGQIKELQKTVGGIMRLIEIYSQRDEEYKTRYKSRTGLPPRYKVLGQRGSMQQNAREIIRGIVKTSALADDLGYGDISRRLIRCAKQAQENKLSEVNLAKITADTLDKIGFRKEASTIRKTAQTIELGVEDLTGGLDQLYQVIDGILGNIKRKNDQLINVPTARKALGFLGTLWHQLQGFKQSLTQPISQLQQVAPEIEQALETTVPTSVFDAAERKTYEIEWSEPDAAGEQTAYVTRADGQQYEVQRDSSGKMMISQQPMEGVVGAAQATEAPAAAQSAQPAQQVATPPPIPETSSQGVGPGAQTSQRGQKQRLEDLNEDDLIGILQKSAPNATPKYRQSKPQLIKLVQDNIGSSVLQQVYNLDVAAAATVFNLKRYSSRQ